MVTREGKQWARESKVAGPRAKRKVSPLRTCMIRDMELAGYTPGTQETYIRAVVKLQDHYPIRPDRLSERQVQQYVLWLRDEKRVPKGTFETSWHGLKFFYYRTLGVDWPLFTRKKVRQPRRKRLPVPIAWEDGHRLIAALRKPSYRLCCALMLALGLRIGDVLALTVQSIDSTQMMKMAAEAVRDLAAEERYVGAEVGILAVLHTWTGRLHHHPHVHMLITGGGVTEDGPAWHDAPSQFLVPVKKLSPLIARRFAEALQKGHPDLFRQIPADVWSRPWCSYCKPYGTGKDAVLQYLARYVFRIAITNRRLVSMDESHVTLRYKDHDTGQGKTERIEGVQFLRRFLFHVLPKGLHKVRYYGLWHPCKRDRQAQARLLLELTTVPVADDDVPLVADLATEALAQSSLESHDHTVKCPKCGGTNVLLFETIRRRKPEMVTWAMGGP